MTNEQFDRLETLLAEAAEKLLTMPTTLKDAQAGADTARALAELEKARRISWLNNTILGVMIGSVLGSLLGRIF